MKNPILLAAWLLLLLSSCRKENASHNLSTPTNFQQYTILQGQHYALENSLKAIETGEMAFVVKFDSSAIYKTVDPENQYDINKLFGFSDNGDQHHQFSARIGWRWSDGALRLFAYTYNGGSRNERELTDVLIGAEVPCSIKVVGEVYQFTVNKTVVTMPRQSKTPLGKGYQLYPHFGGDETAPHEIRIWMKEVR